MKLYHFTAKHLWESIQNEGLTIGAIPFIHPGNGKLELLVGYIWLTKNPDFKQEWCNPKYSSICYARNAVRITVNIPKTSRTYLHYWNQLCIRPEFQPTAKLLNEFGDPSNWYIFKGRIKPSWFTKIDHNPQSKYQDDIREDLTQ